MVLNDALFPFQSPLRVLPQVIVSDLIALHERGTYNALFGLTWCVASVVGPFVGGALSQHGAWRWLFCEYWYNGICMVLSTHWSTDLNIPACLIAAILIVIFLDLKYPQGSFSSKLKAMDWM